ETRTFRLDRISAVVPGAAYGRHARRARLPVHDRVAEGTGDRRPAPGRAPADLRRRRRPSAAALGEVLVVLDARPVAAPLPAHLLERPHHPIPRVDDTLPLHRPLGELLGVLVGRPPIRPHIRVLPRVDVDGLPIGMVGPVTRPGSAAAVEGGGVVSVDGVEVVPLVDVDQLHPPDRPAPVVQLPEHRDHVVGDALVDDQLAGMGLVVEPPVAHRDQPQVAVVDGAALTPGVRKLPPANPAHFSGEVGRSSFGRRRARGGSVRRRRTVGRGRGLPAASHRRQRHERQGGSTLHPATIRHVPAGQPVCPRSRRVSSRSRSAAYETSPRNDTPTSTPPTQRSFTVAAVNSAPQGWYPSKKGAATSQTPARSSSTSAITPSRALTACPPHRSARPTRSAAQPRPSPPAAPRPAAPAARPAHRTR